MQIDVIKFKGNACFVSEWAGFERIKPINLIIGRNNTGKSQLLDLVQILCAGITREVPCEISLSTHLRKNDLESIFLNRNYDGPHYVSGRREWRQLIGEKISWKLEKQPYPTSIKVINDRNEEWYILEEVKGHLQKLVASAATPIQGKNFVRLLADRDIQSEPASKGLDLDPSGKGATNIIKRHILSSNPDLPRELIQKELRTALNSIFAEDGNFSEIQTQEHEETGLWEIYLGEEKKGLIPLSKSGSGLKTIILVLLNLLVIPKIKGRPPSDFVFAFEELENNLHPAMLRRLLRYIENFVTEHQSTVCLTTHSNVALDLFGTSEHAQIIHVTHDGQTARTHTIDTHFRKLGVISELGARPSDILQSNGIIWVEGPSDVIYLSRWIELASEGKFKEGRDYLCAFYGGALLARTQFTDPDSADSELVNLFSANPHLVVVCDSDRTAADAPLKPRVERISEEIAKIPNGMVWITGGKEIENYLPGEVLKLALEKPNEIEDPGAFEHFFPAQKADRNSYAERVLDMTSVDKIDLAIRCRPHMTKAQMESRLDWKEKMDGIIQNIARWNA